MRRLPRLWRARFTSHKPPNLDTRRGSLGRGTRAFAPARVVRAHARSHQHERPRGDVPDHGRFQKNRSRRGMARSRLLPHVLEF